MNMERMKQLVAELNAASKSYYGGEDEIMSNFEWDAKFDKLKALEEETGVILPDSPTQKVSADDTKGEKENHEFPALSLAKTKLVDELIKWANGKLINMSWKLDGLTLVATYDDGKLSKLMTRGNGTVGTNITAIAPAINGIPAEIDYKNHLVVRGEAVISYSDFERINAELDDDKFSNPRNLASGTLNLDDITEVERRNVHFIAFTPVYFSEDNTSIAHNSWMDRMICLRELGFEIVDTIKCDTADLLKLGVEEFTSRVPSFDYPVDGLVICYDDWAYSQTGSVTGHHATRAGYAFKWEDKPVITKVVDIDYATTRTGIISQVAVFEPVEIAGTTVSRATIPNMNYRSDLDIKIGDEIEVIKANMIIPQIVANHNADNSRIKVINDMTRYNYPNVCPCCGGTVGIHESRFGTMNLICTNPDCSMKQVKAIAHFADRDCMNIMGLSEKKIEDLIRLKAIENIRDLYYLVSNYENNNHDILLQYGGDEFYLSEVNGWGEKAVENLVTAIDNSRKCDFISFMHSMGIPNVGKGQAKLLKKHLDKIWPEYEEEMECELSVDGAYDLMGLLFLLRVNHDYDFRVIDGFGEVINNSLCDWIDTYLVNVSGEDIANGNEAAWVLELLDELTFTDKKPEKSSSTDSTIAGKTFVVTGDVYTFKNRKELQEKIESLGGKCTGSVSKKTDYLINNDVNSTSGKNQKAKELGIPIISEEEFIAMIE
jgi:DNA ligase (NAD+)